MTVKIRIALLVAGAGFLASLVFSVAIFLELVEQPFHILDRELKTAAMHAVRIVEANRHASPSTSSGPADCEIDNHWLKIYQQRTGRLICRSRLAKAIDLPRLKPGGGTSVTVSVPLRHTRGRHGSRHETTFRVKSFAFNLKTNGYIVQIARSMNKLEDEIWDLVFNIVAGLLLSSLALIVVSYFTAGKILRPVAEMKALAQEISDKNLDRRLPVGPGKDEFNALSRTINRMLDRLQHSFEKQRNLLFDTSHELKTPLTTMRLAVDEVCASAAESLPSSTTENLLRLNAQVRRMERLVKNLLDLSALETVDALETGTVSLPALIDSLLIDYRLLSEARNIHIDLHLGSLVDIRGDRKKLTRAFSNILDNAVKYSDDGGKITIDGIQGKNDLTIRVTNTGPGIAPDDIDKVFDQFFRAEKSRSVEYGGSGLGLAMVRRIIALHGGRVGLESREGSWTRVTVNLPMSLRG
jgi:two-component system, OmpR family, sensor kinase